MIAILSICGIIGGTILACVAPQTKYEQHFDVIGALFFVGGLSSIGASLASRMCV